MYRCAACKREMEKPFKVFWRERYYPSYHRTYTKKILWCEECYTSHEAKAQRQRDLLDEAQKYLAAGDRERALELIEESNRV